MVPKEQVLEERVGSLEKKVDAGFARVDTDIRELRGSITALQYELIGVCLVIIGAIVGSAVAL